MIFFSYIIKMETVLFLFCIFLYMIKDSVSNDIHSYLETKQDEDISEEVIFKDLEQMYLINNYFLRNAEENDLLCTLSNSKKIALCELIFSLKHYKTISGVALNKVALYLQKLPCEERKLTMEYAESPIIENLKQRMYSCPARNKIIRTSFIEDDLYDAYYLSVGPIQNSVFVYLFTIDEYTEVFTIYDYISNVDLLKLQDMTITVKEAVYELKLNKEIYVSNNYDNAEITYIREQNYAKNNYSDPVCDLEYEKKISLCNIAFDELVEFGMIVNKGAVFLFNMKCINVPVYKHSTDNKELLTYGQNLYPCFGRYETTTDSNFLEYELLKVLYLSSGYKRNSVFVYVSTDSNTFNVIFTLAGIIDNIDFHSLKSTNISLEDVKLESERTYKSILGVIREMESNLSEQIKVIALSCSKEDMTYEKECKLIEQNLVNEYVVQFYRDTDDSEKSDYTEDFYLEDKTSNVDELESETELSYTSKKDKEFQDTPKNIRLDDIIQFGLQIFKLLVDKKIKEIEKEIAARDESKVTVKSIRRKLEKIKVKKDIEEKQKLNVDIQNLIQKMQLYIESQKSQQMKKKKYRKKK